MGGREAERELRPPSDRSEMCASRRSGPGTARVVVAGARNIRYVAASMVSTAIPDLDEATVLEQLPAVKRELLGLLDQEFRRVETRRLFEGPEFTPAQRRLLRRIVDETGVVPAGGLRQ